MSTNRTI